MAVTGAYGVVLEVPQLEPGIEFYTHAGLEAEGDGNRANFRCAGRDETNIVLIGGAPRKRIHHIMLRADPARLGDMAASVDQQGGTLIDVPSGFEAAVPGESESLWVRDPCGIVIRLIGLGPEALPPPAERFDINQPGHQVRSDRAGVAARKKIPPVQPLRLGHIFLYTPDVMKSVAFFSDVLGMRVADYHEDIVSFMCTQKNSEHHVVAFARSRTIGFHHTSFLVSTPDDVGRGGRALADTNDRNDWGFGRHTVGANFFHYIQDPWGSWFEYFADIDFISDYSLWTPTNYGSEDALYNWGPPVPDDFLRNYEADEPATIAALGF